MKENKLIAEFMGLLHVDDDKYMNNLREMKSNGIFFEQGYMTSELMYDTDWNWLMDVVDKIESFVDDDKCAKYNFIIEQSFVEIIDNNTSDTIVETDEETKIESIYQAVIKFIKWYEQNSN
jgi:hypothetical protein